MKFGLFFQAPEADGQTHAERYGEMFELIALAETLGFDVAWLAELHFGGAFSLLANPLVMVPVIAARTRRIRIGTAVTLLPLQHPLSCAEQAATADVLSGGRLEFGVGRGSIPSQFHGFRVSVAENRARFDEALEIIRLAWTQERFSFHGRFFEFDDVRVIPKPIQQPHPPLYQVCVSKDGIENTALRGWPMLNSVLTGPVDQLVANRDTYRATLEKTGRGQAEISALLGQWGVSRQIYVADTDAQALAEAKEAELWYQESFRRFVVPERIEDAHPSLQPGFRAMADKLARVTWDDLVRETLAFGSPETVARHIAYMRDLGVGQVLCWMNFGGLPQDKIRRSMELFAREVMPRFR
jgi:alkanesulfonate monooxygenase SsuD/methylene tetrahydromethanopterin reductase-like flavin-dependent oxidoreductase (luciferase family)